MSVLVLGASGQLALHLREALPAARFLGRDALDIADTAALERAIRGSGADAIVNAAAYTAVDQAESDWQRAWAVNASAPAVAAATAEALGIPLIHVSTDYVFDGESMDEYPPDAPVRPLNAYGRTKLGGELAVASLCERHWILRTSWVFSAYGSNFVRTMLRVGAERDALRVVDDQVGRPTWAGHLAALIARLVDTAPDTLPWGTYHATGGPAVSRHAFAEHIFAVAVEHGLLQRAPTVARATSEEFPSPAARPGRAVLAPSPELVALQATDFDWTSGLRKVVLKMLEPGHTAGH